MSGGTNQSGEGKRLLTRPANIPAYTMFNVWLPTVLQGKAAESGDGGLHEALFEMVL